MYDIAKRRSFDNLEAVWLKEIRANGGENLPVYVVGTKCDLDERRGVPKQEAERWTTSKQFAGYFETSAKANQGFLALFRIMAENNA